MTEDREYSLKLNSLLKIFSGSFIIRIIYTLLGFINSVLLARLLGADHYGVYVFALSIVALLSIPTQFGMPMLVVREFAAFQAKQQWGFMKGLALRSHQFVLVVSVIICSCAALWLWINPSDYSTSKQQVLIISLLLVPVLSLGALRDAMLRGLRHVVLAQLPEGFIRPILLMLGLLVAIFAMQSKTSVSNVMILYIVCSTIAFIIGWTLFNSQKPKELKGIAIDFNSKLWFSAAFPIGLTSAMQVLSGELSILYLGFLSLDSEIAFFRIAILISGIIVIFMQVSDSIVAPYFSRLYQQRKHIEIENLIKKICIITTILTVPVFVLFVIFGEWFLVRFYGVNYQAAYYPLIILSFGQLLNAVIGPVALLLVMAGKQKLVTWSTLLCLLFNFYLHVVLVPIYGVFGAAVSTSTVLIVWNILLWIQVKRNLPIKYFF